jgi:hypothetical protein
MSGIIKVRLSEFFSHTDDEGFLIDKDGKRWYISNISYSGLEPATENITMVGNNKRWEPS